MITRREAGIVALQFVRELAVESGLDLVLLDEYTIERSFGWMFFYTTRQAYETGDPRYGLGGNAPVIVDRTDGSLHATGTAYDAEPYLDAYEALGPERFHSDELGEFLNNLKLPAFGS